MRLINFVLVASVFFVSCTSPGKKTSFCDTTCTNDNLRFDGDPVFQQMLTISLRKCAGDSVTWTHGQTLITKQIYLPDFLSSNGQDKFIKINKAAVSCSFQDTTQVWLTFNDCVTGRGYILKLPYDGNKEKTKIKSALTSFDPKFAIDNDLRAYTDRGNLFAVNVKTGKEVQMTFGKEYDMDFDDIHKSIDTVNVTKSRMYIKIKDKDGAEKSFEQAVQL